MPRGSDFVLLGIFPLIDKQVSVFNGSCRALGPAFRRAQSLRRSLASTDLQSYRENTTVGNTTNNGEEVAKEISAQLKKLAIQSTSCCGEPESTMGGGDDIDVALSTEKLASMEGHKVISPFPDKSRRQQRGRQTYTKILQNSNFGYLEGHGKLDNREKISQSPVSVVGRNQIVDPKSSQMSSCLALKNNFTLLDPEITCASLSPQYLQKTGVGLEVSGSPSELQIGIGPKSPIGSGKEAVQPFA